MENRKEEINDKVGLSYEQYRWEENKQPITIPHFSPVKIIAVNGSIINPYIIDYESSQMPEEYRDNRIYGIIKIEQIILIKMRKHSKFSKEKRCSQLIAPIAELEELKNKNEWANESTIRGVITIREEISRTWVTEQDRKDCFGFTFKGMFFKILATTSYTENENSRDFFLTKEIAQSIAENILEDNPDNLPF